MQVVVWLDALVCVLVGHITESWPLPIGVRSAASSWGEGGS